MNVKIVPNMTQFKKQSPFNVFSSGLVAARNNYPKEIRKKDLNIFRNMAILTQKTR